MFSQTPIDSGIRSRSMELERISRQAKQDSINERGNGAAIDFVKIKRNFEGIQKLQDSIVEAYTQGEKIDFQKINRSAGKITKMAVSLRATLFSPQINKKELKVITKKKTSLNTEKRSVKDLIVDLDNAIGRFVAHPIFQDVKVINTESCEKLLADLEEIIYLSDALWFETTQLKDQ